MPPGRWWVATTTVRDASNSPPSSASSILRKVSESSAFRFSVGSSNRRSARTRSVRGQAGVDDAARRTAHRRTAYLDDAASWFEQSGQCHEKRGLSRATGGRGHRKQLGQSRSRQSRADQRDSQTVVMPNCQRDKSKTSFVFSRVHCAAMRLVSPQNVIGTPRELQGTKVPHCGGFGLQPVTVGVDSVEANDKRGDVCDRADTGFRRDHGCGWAGLPRAVASQQPAVAVGCTGLEPSPLC